MTHLDRHEWEVRQTTLSVATELVRKYHYAGRGPNTGVYRHGLFTLDGHIAYGVAWWLPPTKVAAQSVAGKDWRNVLSLTRLVIAPDMPTNSASYLLGQSIRIIRREGKWTHLVTYADEGQGHTGAIYRATNWEYVGANRGDRVWRDRDGRHVARKSASWTRTVDEMIALGYEPGEVTKKHKFVLKL